MITEKEIHRLRELAKQIREIAELPVQQEHKKLWTAVNDLHMIRPVLHVRDVRLDLLAYEDELTTTIEDPMLQAIEQDLLLRLYEWKHLRLDRVIDPVIKCNCVITDTGFEMKRYDGGVSYKTTDSGMKGGRDYNRSEHFEPQIFTVDDLEKIKTPQVSYDKDETMRQFGVLKEIFDGILDVRLFGKCAFRHNPWDDLITWMGISKGMMNFALEPEFMHAAIDHYIKAIINQVKQYEDLGLLSSNNAFENVGNNGIGYTEQLPPPSESGLGMKLKDIWGSNSDQIMTTVSPAMSEEFAYEYERRYADLFGLYGYGCCERLDHKIGVLRSNFTNLRKISMSPYSDHEKGMEQMGSDYVFCFKPNSNYLVIETGADMDYLRKELINICSLARKYNTNLVINMKTIITLVNDPTRLWKWCTMAEEIVSNY